MPISVAFRAMAAAFEAIHRSQGNARFAAEWPPQHLALGFLHGALKSEWQGEGASPCVVTNLTATLMALHRNFGFLDRYFAEVSVAFECVFEDSALPE